MLTLFFICFSLWGCINRNNFRYKVKYFFFFLLSSSLFGFLASFDGCVLLLLLTEFFILLLFIMMYLTNTTLPSGSKALPVSFTFFCVSSFVIYIFATPMSLSGYSYAHFNFYESALDLVTSDFFLFFQFFFARNPLLVAYCGLILSFFIIFFISFYFQLKRSNMLTKGRASNLEVLRKQNPVKQAKHKAQVRIFKLNVPKR